MIALDNFTKTPTIKTPSVLNRWRFNDLPVAELLKQLQQHLLAQDKNSNWQLTWLNNDGRPVIGLLPKVSWSVYFCSDQTVTNSTLHPNYKIVKTHRDNGSITTAYMSYADWQDELISYSSHYDKGYDSNNSTITLINKQNKQPSYHHGFMGFIGYDMSAHELSPAAKIKLATQPCAVLGHYDIYLTPTDNEAGWTLNSKILNSETLNNELLDIEDTLDNSKLSALIDYLNILDNELSTIDSANQPKGALAPFLTLTANWQKSDYQQAFVQTQRYLQQGDCYQINLTQVWQGCLNKSLNNDKTTPMLIDYLPTLHRNTQAPFAGYISVSKPENYDLKTEVSTTDNVDTISFELLSCSPELFFTFIKDIETDMNHIRTKPIKGTMPRGSTSKQDLLLKQQLTASAKDRAENVMIVDLLRNDLGKYAKTGSVKVPLLFAIESFSNVHHMVSTITAELKVDAHPLAVLFGSLPAGSITGTPKKRAVEIISELEADARGAYCGTMGYMNFDGSGQWNVLIRTLQANESLSGTRKVSLWAGGGITIASNCDDEYQECLDKVGNLLQVLKQETGTH
ncbi:anthranilate synthase component I family protein [Psychrobacter frigidicola]|uniref:Anthranilate synthase component I family protein n=1 Tax=Psychrobacter frigidicola TaxID=45611 RepID=A0A5C7A5H7_9GAMM|nr:anthranilate synthase component I family protein [Psychrobacter frigidicola]TXD96029.1 anthranilate synthase component I family protein [Psychrobacter frigidicola]